MASNSPSSNDNKSFKVAIIGGTGAVGIEVANCLHNLSFPLKNPPSLYASARSKGKAIATTYGDLIVQEYNLDEVKKQQYNVIFLAVSGSFALENARALASSDGDDDDCDPPLVIDNSSAFRLADDVPLVIPEINADAIGKDCKLVANPNCTTAIAAMALYPIHIAHGGITKCIVSTYQAASGAGAEGMSELLNGCKSQLETKQTPQNKVFSHPLPFNVIPHIDTFQENGYTKEEMKVTWETRKIFDCPEMAISCTAVRIPTIRAHSESITIETKHKISPSSVRKALEGQPGVVLVDNVKENLYPMPITATEKNDVEVGRIRQNLVFGDYGVDLFVCGDQLLRGAALNAVLIAEAVLLGSVGKKR